ncbi:hypothetical protein DL95DRAFT_459529 [Leptodontidium sp. 2 PMI_412]|nr:hypothetical protein DL95DRAFT_459529 [Leptodontidium sp. 2 PMI_412]
MSSTSANTGVTQQPLSSSSSTAVPPSRLVTAQSATQSEIIGIDQPSIRRETFNSSPRSSPLERIDGLRNLTPLLPTDQRTPSLWPVASPPRTRQELSFVPEVSSTNFWVTSKEAREVSGEDQEGESRDKTLPHQLIKSGNMVKIYTGADNDCWVLHEDTIFHYSEYFKIVFQGAFAEATQKSITLEEDDSAIFGYFVDWIYSGSVRCKFSDDQLHKNQGKEHFMLYIRLEIFADKYQMNGLSACATDRWSKCHSRNGQSDYGKPFVEEIKLIYEDCPRKSSLRPRVVAAVLKYYLTEKGHDYAYIGQILSCNSSFAADFARDLKYHQELNDPLTCAIRGCSLHTSEEARRRKAIEIWEKQH